MKKCRLTLFLPGIVVLPLVLLFFVGPVYGSVAQREGRISLPIREHIPPVPEQSFLPLVSQRSLSTHDDKNVEHPPINIAKRLRMRRHSEGEATDSRGGDQRNALGQTADPQTDPEDIPGIEYDEQGRPKDKRRREGGPKAQRSDAVQGNGNNEAPPLTAEEPVPSVDESRRN